MTLKEAWGRAFGIASMVTPFLLGTCAAAVASGAIRVHNGASPVALFQPWLTPFALVIGALALALCATIAPVYLTVESQQARNKKLEDTFRVRAFIAGGVLAVLGMAGLALSPSEAPLLWQGMLDHALWAVAITMLLGLGRWRHCGSGVSGWRAYSLS